MPLSIGWFLKYIKHYKEAPGFYSSYGSFMHEILEGFYKGEINREQAVQKFLLEFNSKVEGERPKASTVQKYICNGANYLRSFKPVQDEIVGIEEEVNYEINGVPFVGYIDMIVRDSNGIYLIDHKSRDLKPRSRRKKPTLSDIELDDMLIQLYMYAAAIEQKYGELPYKLCFNCFRSGTMIEEPFNEEAYSNALAWATKNVELITDAEEFYPRLDFFQCKNLCGLNSDCCYFETV